MIGMSAAVGVGDRRPETMLPEPKPAGEPGRRGVLIWGLLGIVVMAGRGSWFILGLITTVPPNCQTPILDSCLLWIFTLSLKTKVN